MKKLFWGICYLMITANLFSQVRVKARVVDASNGASIPSATINAGAAGQLVTNEQGEFSLPVTGSSIPVRITSVGYREIATRLTDAANQEFRLEKFNLFLQPVDIRATRASELAPFAKTNLLKSRHPETESRTGPSVRAESNTFCCRKLRRR